MRFERDYFIHYYDSDLKRRATISSLMRYFEDIAVLHSEEVKLGIDYYMNHHVVWMLYKWDIRINRLPMFKETIKVRTIATSLKSFHAYRYFDILNEQGDQIVTANSMWLFINTDTKKPIKITEDMFQGYDVDPDNMAELEIGEIGMFEHADTAKEFNVRYNDIDTNKHVNNIKYVDWALEAVPEEILLNYSLARLKVNYRKEIGYGSKITSAAGIERGASTAKCIHQISSGDAVLCLLESDWCRQ